MYKVIRIAAYEGHTDSASVVNVWPSTVLIDIGLSLLLLIVN